MVHNGWQVVMMHITRAAIPVRTKNSPILFYKEKEMLKWDISYPDIFRCVIDNSIFTIFKKLNNKYDVHVTVKIGDEFFNKTLYDLETLQKANEMSESVYKGMNRK